MKTKHRILSVLAIMAILAGLCVAMVTPAGATIPPNDALSQPVAAQAYHVGDTMIVSYNTAGFFNNSSVLSVVWGKATSTMATATAVTTTPAVVTTDSTGKLNGCSFKVPASAAFVDPAGLLSNSYTVYVTDGAGHIAEATILVVPGLQLLNAGGVDVSNGIVRVAAGETLTANGSGFAANVGVNMVPFIDMNGNGVYDTGDTLLGPFAFPTTDANGGFTTTFTVTKGINVGGVFSGKLAAVDLSSSGNANQVNKDVVGKVQLLLKPSVTLDPANGLPSAVITATGVNFTAGSQINTTPLSNAVKVGTTEITYDPTIPLPVGKWQYANTPTGIDAQGTVVIKFTIPSTSNPGLTQVTITDMGNPAIGAPALSAQANVNVDPRPATLSPGSGPRGTKVIITATNLTPGGTVAVGSILFGIAPWAGMAIAANIATNGNMAPVTLTVPAGAGLGQNLVAIIDSGNLRAGNYFTVVSPTITVSPTKGYASQAATLTGSGWVPNSNITITVPGIADSPSPTTDAAGNFTAAIDTSMCIPGDNQISANDGTKGNTATTKYTVVKATITATPTTIAAGGSLTVAATGLDTFVAYDVKIAGIGVGSAATDGQGNLTGQFLVPGKKGTQLVEILDKKVPPNTIASVLITVSSGTTGAATVAAGLANISGGYDQVWTLDAGTWKLFDPADVANAEFDTLTPGMAIYIHTSQAASNVSLGGVVRNLVVGWNMIGWVS